GRHRRRHRLLRRGDRRTRQRLRRDPRRPALRRAPDDRGGAHPARLRVPGRRHVRRRHAVPRVQAERSPRRQERRARVSRDLAGVWLAEAAVFALALPLALRSSPYWTFVATLALLYVTIGQGLNFQLGTAGVINLAGAAFAGLGGYAVGLATVAGGWPSWLAVLVGPWVAVTVGTLL